MHWHVGHVTALAGITDFTPGREGSLLSADVLQRMHALEQRAPHLYGHTVDRPQSRSNSSSLPQEAIQAEVARQLAGFDQRAQVQELEIQRLRRQLEEANQREQSVREQVLRAQAEEASRATQIAPPTPQQNPMPAHVVPLQVAQVPPHPGSASGNASGPGCGSASRGSFDSSSTVCCICR